MKQTIKVLCLHIAENQASYRYRVEQFLPHWRMYGIEMQPVCITGKAYHEKIRLALDSRHYDFVWLQRKPLSPMLVNIIASRSKLVYDIDDALYTRQTGHTGKLKSTKPGSRAMVGRINHILKKASIVMAGSEALAAYTEKHNPEAVRVIPTAYEAPYQITCPVKEPGEPVTIGWIGGSGNLSYLKLIDEATRTIQENQPNVRFCLMSGKPPEGMQTNWDFVRWSPEAEKKWLQSIDIGIMPLADDEWSRGKCAFKLIQYMANGKPVVASAVGANVHAVIDGRSGFLASSSRQWEMALTSLISNSELRVSMGEESLRHFLSNYERERVQEQIATILQNHFRKKQPLNDTDAYQNNLPPKI